MHRTNFKYKRDSCAASAARTLRYGTLVHSGSICARRIADGTTNGQMPFVKSTRFSRRACPAPLSPAARTIVRRSLISPSRVQASAVQRPLPPKLPCILKCNCTARQAWQQPATKRLSSQTNQILSKIKGAYSTFSSVYFPHCMPRHRTVFSTSPLVPNTCLVISKFMYRYLYSCESISIGWINGDHRAFETTNIHSSAKALKATHAC